MLSSLWRRRTSLQATISQRLIHSLADYETIIDWRAKKAVLPVLQQKGDTCYATAAVDVVASAHHIYHGSKLRQLSMQELVDHTYFDPKVGGFVDKCFEYMWTSGVALEQHYPISGSAEDSHLLPRVFLDGYAKISPGGEEEMLRILSHYHPLVVRVACPPSLEDYEKGIYEPPTYLCGKSLRRGKLDFPKGVAFHFMTVVAAGTFQRRKVWLLKNSWGEGWGMKGFGIFPRDGTFAGCLGMNLQPMFPLVGPLDRYKLDRYKYKSWNYGIK